MRSLSSQRELIVALPVVLLIIRSKGVSCIGHHRAFSASSHRALARAVPLFCWCLMPHAAGSRRASGFFNALLKGLASGSFTRSSLVLPDPLYQLSR